MCAWHLWRGCSSRRMWKTVEPLALTLLFFHFALLLLGKWFCPGVSCNASSELVMHLVSWRAFVYTGERAGDFSESIQNLCSWITTAMWGTLILNPLPWNHSWQHERHRTAARHFLRNGMPKKPVSSYRNHVWNVSPPVPNDRLFWNTYS